MGLHYTQTGLPWPSAASPLTFILQIKQHKQEGEEGQELVGTGAGGHHAACACTTCEHTATDTARLPVTVTGNCPAPLLLVPSKLSTDRGER